MGIVLSRFFIAVYGWENTGAGFYKSWFVVKGSDLLKFLTRKENPTIINHSPPQNGYSFDLNLFVNCLLKGTDKDVSKLI